MARPFLAAAVIAALAMPALASAQQLAGTVRGANGAPAVGVVVVVQHGGRTDTATTDAAGMFTLSPVTFPAVVEIVAPGLGTLRRAFTASPIDVVLSPPTIRESIVVTSSSATSTMPSHDALTGKISLPQAFLDMVPAVALDEALRVVSGFSLFRRSSSRASNPTTHGVTLRGLSASGASRGLVLLDGVPLNEAFGSWVTWSRVPKLAIGEVEIQRGAQGDVFGSDALGGVIEILPRSLARSLASLDLDVGTEATAEVEAGAGRQAGRVSVFGAASFFRTDGVIPVAPESAGAVDQRSDTDWYNAYGRTAILLGVRRLVFSGWGGRDDRGNGTVVQRNRMSGGTFAAAFDHAGAATHMAARVSVSPNNFYQTFSQVAAGRATESLTSTQFVDTTSTRATIEVGRTVGVRAHVVGRAVVARTSADFRDERPNPALTTDRALVDRSEAISLQAGMTPGSALTLSAGIRHEWRRAPGDADGRDAATVGRFAWAWSLGSRVDVRGAVATSHRWPTLNELARNFQAGAILTFANPDLRPERGRSVDIAGTVRGSRWRLTTAGFWSVVDDAIANVTVTATQRQRRNAGEAHAKGVEIDGDLRVGGRLSLRASTTVVDARFRESLEPPIEGKRIPQVPRVSFAWSAIAEVARNLEASVVWRALSTQFDDDRNVFELAEARQLDLRLAGRMRHIGWHLSLENALDARIEVGRTPLVTLAPGRALRLGFFVRR
jgi:outer membrane cobalamin receptor